MQEIRDAGGPGYDFITVEEDEAANVMFVNNTLLHLASEQIPRGAMVSVQKNITHIHRANYTVQMIQVMISKLSWRGFDE